MTKKLLTLENIRSGAVPSDAVAVGFLLGEIERLRAALNEIEKLTSPQVTLHYHCKQTNVMANLALAGSAHEPRAVDPNGPPHELRPLLENAVKALDMGVAISPGSYVHDELKLLLSQGASRDASYDDPNKVNCIICGKVWGGRGREESRIGPVGSPERPARADEYPIG